MLSHPILEQLASQGVRLGLDRIEALLQAMGEPHRAYPVVHVAGTNGKGSVCSYVTHCLVASGLRVGTTLSPHVEALNERIQLDGLPIDDGGLIEAIEAVDRVRWDWARTQKLDGSPLTYFEFMVAAAFYAFAQRGVDIAVVEVGLGGRLDATNVVHPSVVAIPSIGLDHEAELGSTLAEIAGEKAGIIKRGVPVVLGAMAPEASAVMVTRANALGCELWKPPDLRREFRNDLWSFATPMGGLDRVALGPLGRHQGANALVALGVLHQLRGLGLPITDDALRAGFAKPGLPGRLEILRPGLVVDGAHNVAGATALAAWLAKQPRPGNRILLLGMGRNRNPVPFVKELLPHVDEVVTTRCSHPNAWEPMDLALTLNEQLDAELSAGESIEVTLPEVYAEADEVVVAGSLFVAGAARSVEREGLLDTYEEE